MAGVSTETERKPKREVDRKTRLGDGIVDHRASEAKAMRHEISEWWWTGIQRKCPCHMLFFQHGSRQAVALPGEIS